MADEETKAEETTGRDKMAPKSTGSSEEFGPVIPVGYWVQLAYHDDVPEELVGHIATIVASPWINVPYRGLEDQDIAGWRYDEDVPFQVQTRDEHNVTIEVSPDAFQSVAADRAGLLSYA